VEAQLAVEVVEIGADELAVFNVSRDDIRNPADYRMLYVLGFSIVGAIVTNALVFLYFASLYPSG